MEPNAPVDPWVLTQWIYWNEFWPTILLPFWNEVIILVFQFLKKTGELRLLEISKRPQRNVAQVEHIEGHVHLPRLTASPFHSSGMHETLKSFHREQSMLTDKACQKVMIRSQVSLLAM
jgi:hypothetical protein